MFKLFQSLARLESTRRRAFYQPCAIALMAVVAVYFGLFGGYQGRTAPASTGPISSNNSTSAPLASKLVSDAKATSDSITNSSAGAQASPQVVTVGMYLYSIKNLDVRTDSYLADFYLWFLWKGDNDPTKSFEFMNTVSSPEKRPIYVDAAGADAPDVLPDGRKLQQYHIQGTFEHAFDLSRYPVDEQDLTIEIEDAKATAQELVYVVDQSGLGVHDSLKIPAWTSRGLKGAVQTTTYRTAFGDPRSKGDNEVSNATFTLHIARPAMATVMPNVVPVFFTLLLAWCAFFLNPNELGTRISSFAMAVMSVLFLHLAYSGEVPPGTASLMDDVHHLSYLLLVISTAAAIRSASIAKARDENAAQRFDRKAFVVLVAVFMIGTAGIFVLR